VNTAPDLEAGVVVDDLQHTHFVAACEEKFHSVDLPQPVRVGVFEPSPRFRAFAGLGCDLAVVGEDPVDRVP
jgi:hypothetical protein